MHALDHFMTDPACMKAKESKAVMHWLVAGRLRQQCLPVNCLLCEIAAADSLACWLEACGHMYA